MLAIDFMTWNHLPLINCCPAAMTVIIKSGASRQILMETHAEPQYLKLES